MIILAICLMYFYAAIPFSLLVGLIVYKKDIRNFGSNNIGGSNLGRTCGKHAFIAGFLLDGSKGVFAVLLASILNVNPLVLFVVAMLGHSFSVFVKFKGGKGVATGFGFVLAFTPVGALIAISSFVLMLKISRYVSLSSIVATFVYFLFCLFYPSITIGYQVFIFFMWVSITFLHRKNISRIINKTESKVTWF